MGEGIQMQSEKLGITSHSPTTKKITTCDIPSLYTPAAINLLTCIFTSVASISLLLLSGHEMGSTMILVLPLVFSSSSGRSGEIPTLSVSQNTSGSRVSSVSSYGIRGRNLIAFSGYSYMPDGRRGWPASIYAHL